MPLTGFSTSSTLTLWILSENSNPQPAWCASAPFLHPTPQCIRSLAATAAGIPFLGHHIMDGLCHELPAYLARAEGVSFKAEHGRSGRKERWVGWRQNEDNLPHWASAVSMVLLIQPSAAQCWVFSLLRAAFSGQQRAAFNIMWRPAWCFTTIIAETII